MKNVTYKLILLFILWGCASTLPVSEMKFGRPINEILSKIPEKPRAIKTFQDPGDEKTIYTVYEYDLLPPNARYNIKYPYWILTVQNKFIAYGIGHASEAEMLVNKVYLEYLLKQGTITQGEAERRYYAKYKQLYGDSDPLLDELFAYRIMIADKLDKGEIERSEADYLISKKSAEIAKKKQKLQMQQAQIAIQQRANSLAASQALMQTGLQLLQMQQQQQMINMMNRPSTYTIMPFGRGWIMQGW